jgi:hypothetical protein
MRWEGEEGKGRGEKQNGIASEYLTSIKVT